jgi:ankyrin repeat protein
MTFKVTPLGMALMFGNLDAVLALLKHGADVNFTDNTAALKFIVQSILKHLGVFKNAIERSLAMYPHHAQEILSKCLDGGDSDDDDEEEEPWDRDDWDPTQVMKL